MTSSTRLIVLPAAERDVREILRFTADTWGIAQRNAYFRQLRLGTAQLLAFPEIGHVVDGDVREMPVRQHVVLYRYDQAADVVTILRVMHPRRFRGR